MGRGPARRSDTTSPPPTIIFAEHDVTQRPPSSGGLWLEWHIRIVGLVVAAFVRPICKAGRPHVCGLIGLRNLRLALTLGQNALTIFQDPKPLSPLEMGYTPAPLLTCNLALSLVRFEQVLNRTAITAPQSYSRGHGALSRRWLALASSRRISGRSYGSGPTLLAQRETPKGKRDPRVAG